MQIRVQIQIGYHVIGVELPNLCLNVVFTIPSGNKEQTKMVNSDVPHNSNLFFELGRNYLFQY